MNVEWVCAETDDAIEALDQAAKRVGGEGGGGTPLQQTYAPSVRETKRQQTGKSIARWWCVDGVQKGFMGVIKAVYRADVRTDGRKTREPRGGGRRVPKHQQCAETWRGWPDQFLDDQTQKGECEERPPPLAVGSGPDGLAPVADRWDTGGCRSREGRGSPSRSRSRQLLGMVALPNQPGWGTRTTSWRTGASSRVTR